MLLNLEDPDRPRHAPLSDGCPLPPDFDIAPKPNASWSLGALYRDHCTKLRRYFGSRGTTDGTEDLIQETFARFADVVSRKRPKVEKPQAYINQVARNLLREQARFAARRSASLHVSLDDIEIADGDPVAMLEARDMLARLEAAMAKMKPATREIFMAHRIDGCTYKEIAESTGRSVKSVERHMSRAIYLINRAVRRG